MSRSTVRRRAAGLLHATWRITGRRCRAGTGSDDGFVLLESIIAMTVITIIMSAVGAEFVNSMISTTQQRAKQSAIQLADSEVERIRGFHPSDLLTGRGATKVSAQFSTGRSGPVNTWLAQMDPATDSTAAAGSGDAAAVPTVGTIQKPGSIAYTVDDYLGWCYVPTTGSTDCVPNASVSSAAGVTKYLRAVVALSWSGAHCATVASCFYATSTLISTADEATFQVNQPLPAAPLVVTPSDQTVAVNDVVSLQLNVQNKTGVPPYTWAVTDGTLPAGLKISTTGLISGTVSGTNAPARSVTVTVTDAFLRTASGTFSWTVLVPLAITQPDPQATTTAASANLTLAASGGAGGPYRWSDPTGSLPPGLTLSSTGTVTGTPTTVGNYPVTLTVADKTITRKVTTSFAWTVTYPPVAASNPADQTSTTGTGIAPLQLSASGGSGKYAWSDPSTTLPAGLTITTGGNISGTPTTTGTVNVSLTVADTAAGYTQKVAFIWMIEARPTITAPANRTTSVGASIKLQLATTCSNGPCSYVINSGPSGLSVDNTGLLTGTIGGSAGTYTATIAVTDKAGASTTSNNFTWTVVAAPTVNSPGNRTTSIGAVINPQLVTTCSNGPCGYVLNNGPSGLSIDSSGLFSGTISGPVKTYSGITVTVTDRSGSTATTASFTWVVRAAPTVSEPADRTTSIGAPISLQLAASCSNGPCSYSVNSGPSGLSIDNTGLLTGTIGGTAKPYTGTITVADNSGSTATSPSFTWTVKAAPVIAAAGSRSVNQNGTPSRPLAYTCANANCTISLAGAPNGIGLSATTPNTTANPATSLSVTATSGTVYINGRVDAAATKKAYTLTVSIQDASSSTLTPANGTWTVQ